MKCTIILQNLTDAFYEELALYMPKTKWNRINNLSKQLPHCISIKIGNGSFRDKVEFNNMLRHKKDIEFKLEPRRGYKLATFIF